MGNIKAKTHLEKLGFSEKDKKNSQHDVIQEWTYRNVESILKETVMKKNPHPFTIEQVKWEHQVMHINGNFKMIVGYIDLQAVVDGQFYFPDTKEYENYKKPIFIEVKNQIPNLGELIRQMRAYQTYAGYWTEYMIVSPDDRFKSILNEQGFWFHKYKDPTKLF